MLKHILFWFVLVIIAILNGTARTLGYAQLMNELAAHQISTATGIIASGLATFYLWKTTPLSTSTQAWLVGVAWLLMTLTFEFVFGHFVVNKPWSELLADYNIFAGRVWILYLLWTFLMPIIFWKIRSMSV